MNASPRPSAAAEPDPGGDDDGSVVARSVGDPEQFATLFRRHSPVIQRYVIRRIGPAAADDVVAETFLIAFRQRASFRPDCPDARPWLYGIATNLVRRHWRTEVAQLRLLARTGTDPVTQSFTEHVDEALSAASVQAQLGAALAGLPGPQRDALLLVAWGGLTYDEVATATGVPIGTVQSRVSRARGRLRQALGDTGALSSRRPRESSPAARRVLPASPLSGGDLQ